MLSILGLPNSEKFSDTTATPFQVSCRTVESRDAIDWHKHGHDELCLVVDGNPSVGYAAGKIAAETGTLFLFGEGEVHGFWNPGPSVRLWSLEFRIGADMKRRFSELFELSPHRRVLKLSVPHRQSFCSTCQNLALELGSQAKLNAVAAFAWLTLQLVNVTRWAMAHSKADCLDGSQEIDPQCFELWQRIHRHVSQPASQGPMLFGLNPCHDSLRHRFRKLFGISPQAMLIRLRMERAKELLRTSALSVKEIAHELGYSRQHDLTRAFRKYSGTSPSDWKTRSNSLEL
jgi:mannose-6-phosphate isomerase-like protein (cupin superfamily)